ncbi:MAG TPA: hypothetical protein VFV68_09465 [Agriterribacter sp.]|nr:hypothetical protein [Agriterribacter sp.]
MRNSIISFIFFGNYFVGLLGIILSLETAVQLQVPFNSALYYLLLFSATVVYYTYAYSQPLQTYSSRNPRSVWYVHHRVFVQYSQWLLLGICVAIGSVLFARYMNNLHRLPLGYWLIIAGMLLSAILYYGLIPRSFLKLNLRDTGWIKAGVIGFVWSCSVSLLPVIVLQLEHGYYYADPPLVTGLFIKNWIFCTVNAIMFDMKDYEDDSNYQLKTFVVRFGVEKTIFFILFPLCLAGAFFTLAFSHYRHFTFLSVFFNLLPFLLLLLVSYSMLKEKKILYYLVVIDGLILVKAICGIVAMQFVIR